MRCPCLPFLSHLFLIRKTSALGRTGKRLLRETVKLLLAQKGCRARGVACLHLAPHPQSRALSQPCWGHEWNVLLQWSSCPWPCFLGDSLSQEHRCGKATFPGQKKGFGSLDQYFKEGLVTENTPNTHRIGTCPPQLHCLHPWLSSASLELNLR